MAVDQNLNTVPTEFHHPNAKYPGAIQDYLRAGCSDFFFDGVDQFGNSFEVTVSKVEGLFDLTEFHTGYIADADIG